MGGGEPLADYSVGLLGGMFSTNAAPDFREAARWEKTNAVVIAMGAYYEFAALRFAGNKADLSEWSIDTVPESTRRNVTEILGRLDTLAQDSDAPRAAAALDCLGMLKFMLMQDSAGARAAFQRAVALDPGRHQAWDVLIAMAAVENKPGEFVRVSQERLKHQPTPLNRVLLGRACAAADQWDKAAAEIDQAMAVAPEDALIVLHQSALRLKRQTDSDKPTAALPLLLRVQRLIAKLQGEEKDRRVRDLVLQGAVYSALTDDSQEARRLLEMLLKRDDSDSKVKELLQALP